MRIGLLGTICLLVLAIAGCQDRFKRDLERANELAFQGRYEEAIFVLDELLVSLEGVPDEEANPLRLQALNNAARMAHLFSRRADLAIGYYSRVVELFPGSAEAFAARRQMAGIMAEVGDRAGAIAQYQALVSGFPKEPGVDLFQYDLARGYFAMGDPEQARTECRELLERWPDSVHADRARLLVATTYHVQGMMSEASEAYEEARAAAEDEEIAAHALFEKAGSMAVAGRKDEALEAYLEVLAVHPEPQLVRMRLERLRERMARRDIDNLDRVW